MYCGFRDCWAVCSPEIEGNLSVAVISAKDGSCLQIMINSFIQFGLWVSISAMASIRDRHDVEVLTCSAFSKRSVLPTLTFDPWRLVVCNHLCLQVEYQSQALMLETAFSNMTTAKQKVPALAHLQNLRNLDLVRQAADSVNKQVNP